MAVWELNQRAFDLLLAHLAPKHERAGERYEELRRTLVYYFERHGCLTAHDQADETIDRVSRRIANEEKIEDIFHYCYGTARHVLQEYWKRHGREWTDLDDLPPYQQPTTDSQQLEAEREKSEKEEQSLSCMQRCLESLCAHDRELITRYTLDRKQRTDLAAQSNQTLNALRLRVFHIRERLRRCEEKCLAGLTA